MSGTRRFPHDIPISPQEMIADGHWSGYSITSATAGSLLADPEEATQRRIVRQIVGEDLARQLREIVVGDDEGVADLARHLGVEYGDVYRTLKRYDPDYLRQLQKNVRSGRHKRSKWGPMLMFLRLKGHGKIRVPKGVSPWYMANQVRCNLNGSKRTMAWRWSVRIRGNQIHISRGEQAFPDHWRGE